MHRLRTAAAFVCLCLLQIPVFYTGSACAGGVYQAPEEFIQLAFSGNPPAQQVIWLNPQIKNDLANILGHRYKGLRVRYRARDRRSVWILDEIGKDKPITTGVIVNDGELEKLKVLVFRESRGWEVRHDFFTSQFLHGRLIDDDQLDKSIDNITGATLSVRAVTRQARVALYLHKVIMAPRDQKPGGEHTR